MPDLKITATVSIVVPFHNEEPNFFELYGRLQGRHGGAWLRQFVFVSSSVTALAIEQALAALGVPARLSDLVRGAQLFDVIVLVLTVLAFAVRVHHVNFNSLSEDESAKWAAVTTPVHPIRVNWVS
jgi:hypothetical protein